MIERTVQSIADGKLNTVDEIRKSLATSEPLFAPASRVPDIVLSLPKD